MSDNNSIALALSTWDGKSAKDIKAIYTQYKNDKHFVSNIIASLSSQAKGASWLLKQHLEKGARLEKNEIADIYSFCSKSLDWETRLHLLQSVPYMPIPKKQGKAIEIFIRQGLSEQNKFIRAWSYNALNELLVVYPNLKSEVESIFTMAMRDEAPSVKARIRNIKIK